ncbi:hypothetical protein ASE86_05425 [Sphingomonas sp. Leaf33]|uniref:MarR family winged helix-turn-helix transcriptional regulator n=1 Tax=Sphingomonas sp. Leaf33 TaxID=1736215 RepID=UPI0006F5D50D|nr:MarR family transcriptional regulator [Sphingomonas sp. Leaf33]KQN25652.1 hypothetical protein ASE86_05425 [Sphingomonas sp. Leaf33]
MSEDVGSIGDTLRRAAAMVAQRSAAALTDREVTLAESVLLRTLRDLGAVSPSVLAARMGLTRGAVTRLVDRLRAKRLVVRAAAGRDDRRYQTIALTGAGAVLIGTLLERIDASEAAIFGRLTAAERRDFDHLLRTVIAAACSRD